MTALTLAERVLALDPALAAIPHAFVGAFGLACYAEPRATIDIDLNRFVPAARFPEVAEFVRRDGQARVWWGAKSVDWFFAYDPFHEAGAAARRIVPFADAAIPSSPPST